jgi:hypothetical protein
MTGASNLIRGEERVAGVASGAELGGVGCWVGMDFQNETRTFLFAGVCVHPKRARLKPFKLGGAPRQHSLGRSIATHTSHN